MGALGDVGKIINKNHRYYGKEVVIQWETPKMYHVRVLRCKRPLNERFINFDLDGKLKGTRSAQITFYIKKSSVRKLRGRKSPKNMNTWSCETGELLKAYSGMTRKQIEKTIGMKLAFR